MKLGKTLKLTTDDRFKILYGTVDSVNLKSVYITLSTWIEPKIEATNWNRTISDFKRKIKISLAESKDTSFKQDKIIVDLDIKSSGVSLNKKSYLNCDVTLFLNDYLPIKSEELREKVLNVVNSLITDNFDKSEYFTYSKVKNG